MATGNELRVSDEWRTISAIVDRYEEQIGPQLPDLEPFLEGVPAASRVKVLAALMEVEQEFRWKRQQGKTVEEYLEQFPELRGHDEVVRKLACAECRLRCRAGGENFRKEFACPLPRPRPGVRYAGSRHYHVVRSPAHRKRLQECPQVRPAGIGRYRVESRIGSGAFGVVYRCRHAELDRRVAIKIARKASRSADGLCARGAERRRAAPPEPREPVGLRDRGRWPVRTSFTNTSPDARWPSGSPRGDYTLGDAPALDDRRGRGLAGRPSAAHLPSRRQARQHPHRRGGKCSPHRFRPGPPRRDLLSQRSPRVPGNRLVHEPRAGGVPRQLGRPRLRHLFAGRGAL